MSSFNKITVVGYLGRDPEIRYTQSGDAVCSFSVASTEKKKGRSGEAEDHTLWFKVSVWGRQGEACNEYLHKGSQAYVEGVLRQESYTDRDGNPRTSLVINARDVQFLGGGGRGESGQGDDSGSARNQSPNGTSRSSSATSSDEDEIPF